MIQYISTRGGGAPQTFEQVLLGGLAPDGGLYVPQSLPQMNLESLKHRAYPRVAEDVMFPFIEGCITREDFRRIIEDTYQRQIFQGTDIAPLRKLNAKLYVLELFHGPTLAFKDYALQLLGRVFDHVLEKHSEKITIVGATSGDTGSAAIEGCRHSKHAKIFILHPHGRVSHVQRRQMTTVDAPNVHNIAIEGTFDDCQNLVKAMFNDADFRRKMNLSAINSINWARIMAQIVYYFYAALQFEEPVSFVVPTGNFGNVLAGHYARKMGAPIKDLIIASNTNDILTRFFESGTMKAQGVTQTLSPSMDIQISSNFERYLFELLQSDAQQLLGLMQQFRERGLFSIAPRTLQKAQGDFKAFRADDAQTLATMRKIYDDHGYIADPHTAVGIAAARGLSTDGSVVTLATAHPAKFPDAVEKAIGLHPALPGHLANLLDSKEKFDTLPASLSHVQDYITRHV